MDSTGISITTSGVVKYFKKDIKNQIKAEKTSALIDSLNSKTTSNPNILDRLINNNNGGNSGGSDGGDGGGGGAEDLVLGKTITFWSGKLKEKFDLPDHVNACDFKRLADGQDPFTREQYIQHVKSRTIEKEKWKKGIMVTVPVKTKTHRAGIDRTISAPKSVSTVAMYDIRVIYIHIQAAVEANRIGEIFTNAKMGGSKPRERTGNGLYFAAVHFETRPDEKKDRVAPSLHIHFFQFNLTWANDGKFRSIEPRIAMRNSRLVTAVYRSILVKKMKELGYEMRIDERTGAPEVAGISREYIVANSPRQNEITEKAKELGIKNTNTVAANHRKDKHSDNAEMLRQFYEIEEKFGYPARNAYETAKIRYAQMQSQAFDKIKSEVIENKVYNISSNSFDSEKSLVVKAFDKTIKESLENQKLEKKSKYICEQSLLTDTLNYSIEKLTIEEVREEFAKRYEAGELDEFELDKIGKTQKTKDKDDQDLTQTSQLSGEHSAKTENADKPNKEQKSAVKINFINEAKLSYIPSGKTSDHISNKNAEQLPIELFEADLNLTTYLKPEPDTDTVNNSSQMLSKEISENKQIVLSKVITFINKRAEKFEIVNEIDLNEQQAESPDRQNHPREIQSRPKSFQTTEVDSKIKNNPNAILDNLNKEHYEKRFEQFGETDSKQDFLDDTEVEATRTQLERSTFIPENDDNRIKGFLVESRAKDKYSVEVQTDFQAENVEMDQASRRESGESLEKTEFIREESAAGGNVGIDAQTIGNREINSEHESGNISTAEEYGAEDSSIDQIGKREITEIKSQTQRFIGRDTTQKQEIGRVKKSDRSVDERQELWGSETARVRDSFGESQKQNNSGELESYTEYRRTGEDYNEERDRADRETRKIYNYSGSKDNEAEGNNKVSTGENGTENKSNDLGGEGSGKEIKQDKSISETINRTADLTNISGVSGIRLVEFPKLGGLRAREIPNNEDQISESLGRDKARQQKNGADNIESKTALPASGEFSGSSNLRAKEFDRKEAESTRQTAKAATQIINVKFYSGQLDRQITDKWTQIISESDPKEFLTAILENETDDKRRIIIESIDEQTSAIAQHLELSKPKLQTKPNFKKLAESLAKVEIENFEMITGDLIDDKVSDEIINRNVKFATDQPTEEQLDQIQEDFVDLGILPLFTSNLEAETYNSLLHPYAVGFDEEKIVQIQREVDENLQDANKLANLIQIGYGGQSNYFTDEFKSDLANEIYGFPAPTTELYQTFKQFDWRNISNIFSPLVNNLAEQNNISITPPTSDEQRNKMLTEFISQQLVNNYKNQNAGMEIYVQNNINDLVGNISSQRMIELNDNMFYLNSTNKDSQDIEFSNSLDSTAYEYTSESKESISEKAEEINSFVKSDVARHNAEVYAKVMGLNDDYVMS